MRDQKSNLKQEVLENAKRFEFFEIARALNLLVNRSKDPTNIERPLSLRFRSAATKNFPSGEVQQLTQEGDLIELYTNVIGLFGPTGVLPHHDKDMVAGGQANRLMQDFLDIFNSRIIVLFFEAWKANRQDVLLEMFRRDISSREDSCTMALLSICGLGLESTRAQHLFSDEVFASSAGLLSRNIRSASAIRRCVENQFKVPVKVREFVEERVYLPRAIQTRLQPTEGYNILGRTAVVGESVLAHRQRFEVRLGPLEREDFDSLCPYGEDKGTGSVPDNIAFQRLVDLIKAILKRPLDFDIRFQVKPEAVSATQLGSTRLGFDSWVISEPTEHKRDDTIKRFTWDVSVN